MWTNIHHTCPWGGGGIPPHPGKKNIPPGKKNYVVLTPYVGEVKF